MSELSGACGSAFKALDAGAGWRVSREGRGRERGSIEWDALVGGWLHGGGENFSQGDAGKDEQGAGGAAAAEAFAEDEEGGDPGEDGLEGEDESGVGGGEISAGPRTGW